MRDFDFKVISAGENSNKFQKTRFWKEKSVEDVVTLGPTAQATLVIIIEDKNPKARTLYAARIPYSFFQVGGRYYGSTFAASALIVLFSELLKIETFPKIYYFLKKQNFVNENRDLLEHFYFSHMEPS